MTNHSFISGSAGTGKTISKIAHVAYLSSDCDNHDQYSRHENCSSPVFLVHNQNDNSYELHICPCKCHRDVLGLLVRKAWVRWAKEHPQPKPSWLLPYEALNEQDKEADRQIGTYLFGVFVDWLIGKGSDR